jgi:hypothetical protein
MAALAATVMLAPLFDASVAWGAAGPEDTDRGDRPVPSTKMSKAERAAARRHFRRGRRFFKRRKFDEAIAAFKKAYESWKHRVILFNLALAYAFKKQTLVSARYLHRFLKKAPPKERRLPKILNRVQDSVGVLNVKVPDPDAEIYIDGRLIGRGEAEAVLMPGSKVLELRKKDRVVKRAFVRITAGKETVWELGEMPALKPRPQTRPSTRERPGEEPDAREPAKNAKKETDTRKPDEPLRPARPAIPADHRERKSSEDRGTSTGGLHWSYFAVGVATTVAAAISAGALSYQTRSLHEEFQDDDTNASLAQKGRRYQDAANAMWGVTAGVAVVTGVVAIFTEWRPESAEERQDEPASVDVSVHTTPSSTGLTIRW